MFWAGGYGAVYMAKDVGRRELDLFSDHVRRNGRADPVDIRLTLNISAWFAPVSIRDGRIPTRDEIVIAKRTGAGGSIFPNYSALYRGNLDMAHLLVRVGAMADRSAAL